MTERIRFTLARQVLEAFPSAAEDLGEVPENISPQDHIAALVAAKDPSPAVLFAALTLPKREAVWWGCLSIRGLKRDDAKLREGLAAAENWVREPEEGQRRAAGKIAEDMGFNGAGAWIAFAAFTSGGSLAPAGLQAVPPPADSCGRSVFAAIMQAVRDDDAFVRLANIRCAIESFSEFAQGGEGTKAWAAGPRVIRPEPRRQRA
jgi:hypothetical protein